MNIILDFIIPVLLNIEYISFFYTIFRKDIRKHSVKKIIGITIIIISAVSIGTIGPRIELILFFEIIIIFFTVYLFYKIKFINSIKLFFIAFPALSILEVIFNCIIESILHISKEERITIYTTIIILLLWIYYLILGRKLDREAFQINGKIWILFSTEMIIMVMMISYFATLLNEILYIYEKNIGIIFILIGGIVIYILNYAVLYYFNIKQKYKWKALFMEKYNEQQRIYFKQIIKKEQDTKKFRHDIISDLLNIQNFLDKEDYESGKKYVREMLDGICEIKQENYDVGNDIINILINYYLMPLKSKCEIRVTGYISGKINILYRDLSIVISNLLSNAVEAIDKGSDRKKEIELKVRQGTQFLYIIIKNTIFDTDLILKNNIPDTTKNNSEIHGFGIRNIVSSVEKYNGFYTYKIEDGYYVAEVCFEI